VRAWLEAIQKARRRRNVERTLAGPYARGRWTFTIRQDDEYLRIYMPYALGGVIALSPRTAERILREIKDREFQRALATR